MKIIVLLILVLQLSTCSKNVKKDNVKIYKEFGTCFQDLETESVLENCKGKIVKVNDELWVIQPDSNTVKRLAICQIPDELKNNDLNIVFSGEIKKIAPNIRYAATPFVIKEIIVSEN